EVRGGWPGVIEIAPHFFELPAGRARAGRRCEGEIAPICYPLSITTMANMKSVTKTPMLSPCQMGLPPPSGRGNLLIQSQATKTVIAVPAAKIEQITPPTKLTR